MLEVGNPKLYCTHRCSPCLSASWGICLTCNPSAQCLPLSLSSLFFEAMSLSQLDLMASEPRILLSLILNIGFEQAHCHGHLGLNSVLTLDSKPFIYYSITLACPQCSWQSLSLSKHPFRVGHECQLTWMLEHHLPPMLSQPCQIFCKTLSDS